MDDSPLAALLADLVDEVRGPESLSQDISTATTDLFRATNDAERAGVLSAWLQLHQPCIFGKMAARDDAITYCFLTDEDLAQTDLFIRGKIASARLEWRRRALEGRKHGFIIAAVSKRIAYAQPDVSLMRVALKLGGLYLKGGGSIEPNHQYHDELMLRQGSVRRRWCVGVNYFSTQGDGRWWHDHRIAAQGESFHPPRGL